MEKNALYIRLEASSSKRCVMPATLSGGPPGARQNEEAGRLEG
jgi:hypothetical protein